MSQPGAPAPRPAMRLHYLSIEGREHVGDVLGARFDLDGTPYVLAVGSGAWVKQPDILSFNDQGMGMLGPYIEATRPEQRLEAHIGGRPVGEAEVFTFHRYTRGRVELVRGEDGATLAYCDGDGWLSDEDPSLRSPVIEFSVCEAFGWSTVIEAGPRARLSSLAAERADAGRIAAPAGSR